MVTAPKAFRVRMYNVGFGDCFLLTFYYATPAASGLDPNKQRNERHVLIDFGSTSGPRSRLSLKRVAEMVLADTNGRLDALVISHRHKDHLSAFGVEATAGLLRPAKPLLVVRSWTENPRLPANAGDPDVLAAATNASPEARYLARLRSGQELAARIVRRAEAVERGRHSSLVQLAKMELANASAVDELERLSAGRRGEYVHAGQRTRLNRVAPGVSFRVLGPPTPTQWPAVARQASRSDEFWLTKPRQVSRLYAAPESDADASLGTARWILDRLRQDEQRQVASLVRWLDDALNNTSVVLLIEVGDHKLLFGGDAQIENWGWVLDKARRDRQLADALADVTLYKVGHHGSRNATPKSLYRMWAAHSRPFISMLSTKSNVHGSGATAVPRAALVEALRSRGELKSTDERDADWIEARAELPRGDFEFAEAPAR